MKNRTRLAAGALALLWLGTAVRGGSGQPFFLTLIAPKSPLKSGEMLRLTVKVTNSSDQRIGFLRARGADAGFIYKVEVRDAKARMAPPSAYLRGLRGKPAVMWSDNTGTWLDPGGSFEDIVAISRLYDLTRPGAYTITVSRSIEPWQHVGKGIVRSNTISVTVVP